jgi:hypothetical protein
MPMAIKRPNKKKAERITERTDPKTIALLL